MKLPLRVKDITGQRFHSLAVLEFVEVKDHHAYWKCQCDCGKITIQRGTELRYGKFVKSCGCLRDRSNFKHGDSYTSLYSVWGDMKDRCHNPKSKPYSRYGGRGIKVCEQWHKWFNFKKWALQCGYKEGLTIDRIDNDGDYCPENCQWLTRSENSHKKGRFAL
jgi:hypothetical protein